MKNRSAIIRRITRKALLAFGAFACSIIATAQQENTMYFMDRVPYVSTLNPAITPECKFYLGGLLFPISGQIPPSMYASAYIPFSYSDAIRYGDGKYSENLVGPYYSVDYFNDFKKKARLQNQNVISAEFHVPLLNFGFRIKKKHFVSFGITEKIYANSIFPKDLLIFPAEGNGAYDEITLNGLAFNAGAYREYALGYKHQVNKYFKIGATIKYLNGYYNIYSLPSEITLKTNRAETQLELNANMQVNTSIPIDTVSLDSDGNVNDITTRSPSNEELVKLLTFSPNRGVAFDFGLAKDFNSEITLYASAVDIGFINWNSDPYTFDFQGKQNIVGVKIDSLDFEEAIDSYKIDSLFNDFQYKASKGSYRQWLPAKFYVGADYRLKKWVKLGLVYRAEYTNKHLFHAVTGSVNLKYAKFANTSLSYTIKNNSFSNLGFGTSFAMGPYTMFFISDNIGAAIWWHKSQLFAFRMGTSMVFGTRDKKKAQSSVPLLPQYGAM